jgi:serine/threonine-protein kinase HSL1, negative regulator of Swe1 kinase
LRFWEDQLENYQGPPIEYSVSDYHHAPKKPIQQPSLQASLQGFGNRQIASQYSILKEYSQPRQSHSYQRQASMVETERSYDPFRTSRNQISRGPADRSRITVLRGPSGSHQNRVSKASLNRRVMSRASVQHAAITRVQQADVYSLASSPLDIPNPSRTQSSAKAKSISRCSSRRSLSHSIVVHASSSYRRGVSFAQMRRPPNTLHQANLAKESELAALSLQERYIQDSPSQASPNPQSLLAADSPQSAVSTVIVRSRKEPRVDNEETPKRNERPMSSYWKEDARQVSSELEKACDEAFNRYSAASTAITGMIETSERETSSPATSIGIHGARCTSTGSRRLTGGSSLLDRPLPLPPAYEHLGSFTYQELAKTRALLQKRAADTSLTGHFDDIIAHLDRLMQPSAVRVLDADRRAVSAPGEQGDAAHGHDEFEKLLSRGPFGLRSTSEPITPSSTNYLPLKRHDLDDRSTVRAVVGSNQKPISPTKPLTIRKKRSDLTDPSQRPRSSANLIRGELSSLQTGERRSAGLSLLESSLEPIKEDEKEARGTRDFKTLSGESKKRGWFRRHERAQRSQDGDQGPPLPPKDYLPSPEHLHTASATGTDMNKRASDVPSDESRASETRKPSGGRGMFFKIFSKWDSKEPKNVTARSSGGTLGITKLISSDGKIGTKIF